MQNQNLNKKKVYAQAIELDFLTNLMKTWKKRNHKILHLGIEQGIEPTFFWDLGYEVTAYAQNLQELEQSQEKNGKMIEYAMGVYDHLPFEDKTFDYAILTHTLASSPHLNLHSHSRMQSLKHALPKRFTSKNKRAEKNEHTNIKDVIQEAVRVCANSVLILENSSFAFEILPPALSPLYLRQVCEDADAHEHSLHYALSTPSFTWRNSKAIKSWLALPHKIPFGSLIALQIDISQEVLTTLPSYTSYAVEEV